MRRHQTDLSLLIQMIYAAVEDPSAWDRFLEAYRLTINADQVVFALGDEEFAEFGFIRFVGTSDDVVREYNERWADQDPWAAAMLTRLEEGAIEFGHHLCPDEVLVTLPIYQEFLRHQGWHYGIGAVVLKTPTALSVISAARRREKGPCGAEEYGVLQSLLPHLQQAARMHGRWARLRTETQVLSEYLDQLPHGFALVSDSGQLLFGNQPARDLFAAEDGLRLRSGIVTATTPELDQQLRHGLSTIGRHAAPIRLAVRRRGGATPFGLVILPVSQMPAVSLGVASPAAAVLIIDPERRAKPDQQMLLRLFSLTPAEAAFATRLAQGFSLEDIAAQKKVSSNTARTHLKRLFQKTGTSRQSELVRVLMSIPEK